MASNLEEMASNLIALSSNLLAMAWVSLQLEATASPSVLAEPLVAATLTLVFVFDTQENALLKIVALSTAGAAH